MPVCHVLQEFRIDRILDEAHGAVAKRREEAARVGCPVETRRGFLRIKVQVVGLAPDHRVRLIGLDG